MNTNWQLVLSHPRTKTLKHPPPLCVCVCVYLMWNFLQAVQSSYVIQSVYGRRQASVETEDLSVDQRGERQVVKQVCEVLPHVSVAVLPQALVVEAVDLCDLPRLVVPSQDGDSLLETNL